MCSFDQATIDALDGLMKHTVRWVVLKMPDGSESECVFEAQGAPTGDHEADFNAFKATIPEDRCRWLFYDLEYEKGGVHYTKIVFV